MQQVQISALHLTVHKYSERSDAYVHRPLPPRSL
nr:MAG TPA: hypothetical protein [Caudoviricetes sp.]